MEGKADRHYEGKPHHLSLQFAYISTGRCLSAEKSQELYVRRNIMTVLFKLPYVMDFY
jgi:hypothetical protein